jgi:hypothetical protein
VPTTRETAEPVRRAHRALTELKQRQAIDDRRVGDEAREGDDELARWHTDDRSAGADGRGAADAAAPDHDREQTTEDADDIDDIDDIDVAPAGPSTFRTRRSASGCGFERRSSSSRVPLGVQVYQGLRTGSVNAHSPWTASTLFASTPRPRLSVAAAADRP